MPGDAEIARFWKHVQLQKDGCWLWAAGTFKAGSFALHRPKTIEPRRFIWEQINGPLQAEMQLHSTCENAECINPEHQQLRKER